MHGRKFWLAAALALGLVSAAQAEQGVRLASGFTDFTTWSVYGSAVASNDTPGNGFTYSNLRLTAPGVGGSAGAGFAPDALVLDFNQSFTFDFNFFIAGNPIATRGDGFTFTLASAAGVGGTGSGLGYDGLQGNSVAFAVDTFHFSDEPVSPSLQILKDGSVQPLAFTETGLGDAIRNQEYQYRGLVTFTPSGNADQQGTLRGSILYLNTELFSVSAPVDLSSLGLTANDPQPGEPVLHFVYFGFTGANGAAEDGHFITSAAPVPEPSTYAMLLAGMALLGFMARRRLRAAVASA